MGAVLLCTMHGASNACWWLGGGRERSPPWVGLDLISDVHSTQPARGQNCFFYSWCGPLRRAMLSCRPAKPADTSWCP